MNMDNIIVDKGYNLSLKDEGVGYYDTLDDIIDEFVQAKGRGEISDAELRILARIALQKALRKDVRNSAQFIIKPKTRRQSLFLAYSEMKRSYVS